jgi:hypothetical protein
MKNAIKLLIFSPIILLYISCDKKDDIKSDQAELLILELEVNASTLTIQISDNNLSLNGNIPYGTAEVRIKDLSISDKATSSIKEGDIIQVSDSGFDIMITAQNQIVKNVYHLSFTIGAPSNEAIILELKLEADNILYSTTVSDTLVTMNSDLPYGTLEAGVQTLKISNGATCSIHEGIILAVSDTGINITVLAQDQISSEVYHLSFSIAQPSDEAKLLELVISYYGEVYQTLIDEINVSVDKEFAYNAEGNFTIHSFTISENAQINIEVGQEVDIYDTISINIFAEDGTTSNTYLLALKRDIDGALLIEQSSYSNCLEYNTYRFAELMLENNLWNSINLPPGTFSQCIYQYQIGTTSLFGWEWSFAEDQHGVNAFPEIIYGLKPWYSWDVSTTINLPREISEIAKLKVIYDCEEYIDDGEYNLAFDNWICSSSTATPESILFEFMIWEDRQYLTAFGDYQGELTTTNGVYKFYKGEPDWEPPGCNWTYLAFVRIENRSSGIVDIDEMLTYLVNLNIVTVDDYLVSIELGNEVGNSKGYTVFKSFVVDIE